MASLWSTSCLKTIFSHTKSTSAVYIPQKCPKYIRKFTTLPYVTNKAPFSDYFEMSKAGVNISSFKRRANHSQKCTESDDLPAIGASEVSHDKNTTEEVEVSEREVAEIPGTTADSIATEVSDEAVTPEVSKLIEEISILRAELKFLEKLVVRVQASKFMLMQHARDSNFEETDDFVKEIAKQNLWALIEWPTLDDPTPFWKQPAPVPPPTQNAVLPLQDKDTINVVHITAEMAPLAKVGGLADVVTGLARACIARGHKVTVILPYYECLDVTQVEQLSFQTNYRSYHKGDWIGVQAHSGIVSDVPVIFLKPENHFFLGNKIYSGSYNELEAYLFFGRASLEYLQTRSSQPDIIHLHEWHTGVVGMLYWDVYHKLSLRKPRLVLTIHNMEHQGECRVDELSWCGLDGQEYATVERCVDERTIGHNPERLSLLKGGIVYSNAVTTVSPTYVQETLCTGWMSATLHANRNKYSGILNGIDTEIWDPSTDHFLPAKFDEDNLLGKAICKHYVQRGLGLNVEVESEADLSLTVRKRVPLVVCVTRLVAQKGIHLIRHAIFHTQQQGGQFILLGSSPVGHIQADFERLAAEFADSKDVKLILTYSDALSHFLFAAGDIILVPSMFEPCGLTQMIGMRYGMVPVVRRTGGLADTVFDVDDERNGDKKNGFVFDGIDEGSLNSALDRALRYYSERPEWWTELVQKVLTIENSWNKSAGEYLGLYRSIRAN